MVRDHNNGAPCSATPSAFYQIKDYKVFILYTKTSDDGSGSTGHYDQGDRNN
ncbi:MAG TPA: hypothetical protein VJ729_15525 [Nitrososphaeraceae archaeon]|nr:hypothetical protein [Nitrososphaeraceae archaeon]